MSRGWLGAATTAASMALSIFGVAGAEEVSPRIADLRAGLADVDDPRVFVVAHRACHERAPENSLMSIERCIELGVDIIEVDVRTTTDGALVMFHDSEVSRTTDGYGYIAEMTLEEVRALRLKERDGGPGAHLTSERVPTLAEFLAAAKDHLIVHLDVKHADPESILAIAEEVGATSSLLMKITAEAGAADWSESPYLGRTLVRSRLRDDGRPLAERIRAFADHDIIAHTAMFTDPSFIDGATTARDQGQRVWVATQQPAYSGGRSDARSLADPDAGWGALIEAGVTILETDRPSWLIGFLERSGRR